MKRSISVIDRHHLIGIILWLGIWEVACLALGQAIYLPSPGLVFIRFFSLFQEPQTYHILLVSSLRVLISFLLAAAAGILFGLAGGIRDPFNRLMEPMVAMIRSTPVISVIILAIIWLPSGQVPVFSGFLMCFPILYTSMVTGVRQTDHQLMEMAKVYRLSRRDTLLHIIWPSALPYLYSGMISSLGMAWKVIAAAEVLSLPQYAIGSKLHDAKVYLESVDLFAWTLLIILLSFMFNRALAFGFRKFRTIR